jgi:hypothetical protein
MTQGVPPECEKFTYQLSDHFPLWVQLDTDIDGERLNQIVLNGKK